VNSAAATSAKTMQSRVVIRDLGFVDYQTTFDAMRRFTDDRTPGTPDELWVLEHPPVYTRGLNDRREPFENPAGIPVIQSDRGGQITYHGPGQLVIYTLIDLRRRGLGVRDLVAALEQSVIDFLGGRGVVGERRAGAPGIYVGGRKIAQLGLRIRRGGSYHGLSVNVNMDLEPFHRIKPCGYSNLETIDLAAITKRNEVNTNDVKSDLLALLIKNLGYNPGDSG